LPGAFAAEYRVGGGGRNPGEGDIVQHGRPGHARGRRASNPSTGMWRAWLHRGPIARILLLFAPAFVACGGVGSAGANPGGVGAVGVQDPSASPTAITLIRLNEKVRVGGLELTVLEATSFEGTKSQRPAPGHVYVGYKLKITAVDTQQRIIASNFRVHADGTKEGSFSFVAGNRAWQPILPFDRLRKGEAATGWLSFQVPQPSRYVSLTYNGDEYDTAPDIKLDIACCP
jgi:hypothetical protein